MKKAKKQNKKNINENKQKRRWTEFPPRLWRWNKAKPPMDFSPTWIHLFLFCGKCFAYRTLSNNGFRLWKIYDDRVAQNKCIYQINTSILNILIFGFRWLDLLRCHRHFSFIVLSTEMLAFLVVSTDILVLITLL